MAAYEAQRESLEALGVKIAAASVDGPEKAQETVERLSFGFPVGHSLPMLPTATALGGYYSESRQILHATNVVVLPAQTVGVVSYSSGAVGRIGPDSVLRLVEFWKSRQN